MTLEEIIKGEIYTNASVFVSEIKGNEDIASSYGEELEQLMSKEVPSTNVVCYEGSGAEFFVCDESGEWCEISSGGRVEFLADEPDDDYVEELVNLSEEQSEAVVQAGYSMVVEALQFWIVSEYLGSRLKHEGELVSNIMGLWVWGRTGCGYSLEDEPALIEISKKMGNAVK